MTTTRPTIDSAQAHPDAGSSPIAVNSAWNPYMIQATSHSIGSISVLKKSHAVLHFWSGEQSLTRGVRVRVRACAGVR